MRCNLFIMQYLLTFKTLIGYFIELNWPRIILNWIYYWIELAKNNFELNFFFEFNAGFFLIEYFFWIESWQFSFELKIELNHFRQFSFESKIELNHFQAKFNHWLNRQIVPPRARVGGVFSDFFSAYQQGAVSMPNTATFDHLKPDQRFALQSGQLGQARSRSGCWGGRRHSSLWS